MNYLIKAIFVYLFISFLSTLYFILRFYFKCNLSRGKSRGRGDGIHCSSPNIFSETSSPSPSPPPPSPPVKKARIPWYCTASLLEIFFFFNKVLCSFFMKHVCFLVCYTASPSKKNSYSVQPWIWGHRY